jgi:hypothetical protein
MTPRMDAQWVLICASCGVILELCAFCEREHCPVAICSRSLRNALGESMAQPHPHAG